MMGYLKALQDYINGEATNKGCVRENRSFQTLLRCMVGLQFTIVEEGN
jgi:hypothetical protein